MKKLTLILTITITITTSFADFSAPNEETVKNYEAERETHYQRVTEALIRSLHLTGQEAEDFRLLREELERNLEAVESE